jgi:alpha-N-acetylglucosamine transferase
MIRVNTRVLISTLKRERNRKSDLAALVGAVSMHPSKISQLYKAIHFSEGSSFRRMR